MLAQRVVRVSLAALLAITGLSAVPRPASADHGGVVVVVTVILDETPGDSSDDICGTKSALVVPAGASVYICYTITNHSAVTLTHHDLEDSEFGSLMDDFPYGLAPGTSAFWPHSAVVDEGFTATATWTARTTEVSYQSTDSITVAVAPVFDDIAGNSLSEHIVWAFENEITKGCQVSPPLFCPSATVTRGQMATFIDRALELPESSTDYFDDDDGTTHEDSINRVAEAGITFGCATDAFCPNAPVLRDQMASFLARAFDLPATVTDYFTDDSGNTHQTNINRLAAAEITSGCTATRFCPKNPVTRAQMTAFLHRAMGD